MPTELEELVEFLHHGNTQIRQIACENLVSYSTNASLFKKPQFVPINDLKLLVRDYPPIAKNALTILINLTSHDSEILNHLAEDGAFLSTLVRKVTNDKDTTAYETTQLLANLSKSPSLDRLLTLELPVPPSATGPKSPLAINQLLDLFVSGSSATSSEQNYDYLSYLLADLSATHAPIRTYFLTPQSYDSVIPLSKIVVFTEHSSLIRRKGVASTIKNVSFDVSQHSTLLDEDKINILPYLLLPLTGNEEFSAEDLDAMLPDLQLLPPDKKRESDNEVIVTHVETLMLLTTTRQEREKVRAAGVYPVIRVLHEAVEDESVREVCERLVNVLMRDEEGQEDEKNAEDQVVKDREVEEVF